MGPVAVILQVLGEKSGCLWQQKLIAPRAHQSEKRGTHEKKERDK